MTMAATEGARAGLFRRLVSEPNPIWMREMRQSLRLGRTPWILLVLTLTISLVLCTAGGVAASERMSPAQVGSGLFQAFFSFGYMVVVVVGPAVAANGIAAEREGRTWEAVLLAGLDANELTRGKFLAAYTTLALYIVTLAPIGALSFLFGGVTATEVVVAFAFLFLVAALSVAFGLAVSSLMQSLRGALVVTLALAVFIGPMLYGTFGIGGSLVIHNQWSDVPEGLPIWLPVAWTRAELGLRYVIVLLLVPLVLLVVPARFLFEVTIANLTGDTDDQSTGLKRWFLFSTPPLAAVCVIPTVLASHNNQRDLSIGMQCLFFVYALFCALLFAREPIGPSRRVRVHWDRRGASSLQRFFGPGLAKTSVLVALVGVLAIGGLSLFDAVVTAPGLTDTDTARILLLASYAAPFFIFTVGLLAWLRSRGANAWVARVIAVGLLFLISAGPWVVAAIVGALASNRGDKDWLVIGAPSPFYVFLMIDEVRHSTSTAARLIFAGMAAEIFWGAAGLFLLWRASRRCEAMMAAYDDAVARAEAALGAEDEARRATGAELAAPLSAEASAAG